MERQSSNPHQVDSRTGANIQSRLGGGDITDAGWEQRPCYQFTLDKDPPFLSFPHIHDSGLINHLLPPSPTEPYITALDISGPRHYFRPSRSATVLSSGHRP